MPAVNNTTDLFQISRKLNVASACRFRSLAAAVFGEALLTHWAGKAQHAYPFIPTRRWTQLAALAHAACYLFLFNLPGSPKNEGDFFGMDATATDHVIAIVADCLDDQLPSAISLRSHLSATSLMSSSMMSNWFRLKSETGSTTNSSKRTANDSDVSGTPNTSARCRSECWRTSSSDR